MWGTKKDASTTVVLHTVRQLTKLDSNKRLSVKRKFYEGEPGRRDRWWFLLRGPESVLDELENLWNCVSLQVGWRLETCTKPSDDSRVGADSNANERVTVHAAIWKVKQRLGMMLVTALLPSMQATLDCQAQKHPLVGQLTCKHTMLMSTMLISISLSPMIVITTLCQSQCLTMFF